MVSRHFILAASCLVTLACRSSDSASPPRSLRASPHETNRAIDEPAAVSKPAPSANVQPVVVVALTFDILRAELPVSDIHHSAKLWNHVDELRIDADSVARLARNGLRIGAMSREAWPAVNAILDVGNAERRRDESPAPDGQPLLITFGTVQEGESIFGYGAGARLAGKTFTAGEKTLTIDYAFRAEATTQLDLQLGFEIRHDQGVMTWERSGGIIREVPAIDRHVFEGSVVRLTLADGETLVIGPTTDRSQEYLLGRRFLINTRGDRTHETILFVTPRPQQTQREVRFNAERS